jgi:hypothetical protein
MTLAITNMAFWARAVFLLEIMVNMTIGLGLWYVVVTVRRICRNKVSADDEATALQLLELLDNHRDNFVDTLVVTNPFVITPKIALGEGEASLVETPEKERVRIPSSPTRSAVALAFAVKVKMGTTPTLTVANRMVASKLAFGIAKAHNVRDADMCMLVPAAVQLVFTPSQYDVKAQRTFMTRAVAERHTAYTATYEVGVVGRMLAAALGDSPMATRRFSDK